METEEIKTILLVLSSVGFGAILPSFINYFTSYKLKKGDYKRDHYKYLIAKRIEAYNYVEEILVALDQTTHLYQNDRLLYMGYKVFVFDNEQKSHCDLLLEKFSLYNVYKNWLSANCADNMAEIFGNLSAITNNREKSKDAVIIVYTEDLKNRIKELKEKATKTYHKDILELHQIEDFVKQKAKNSNYSIYLDSKTVDAMKNK